MNSTSESSQVSPTKTKRRLRLSKMLPKSSRGKKKVAAANEAVSNENEVEKEVIDQSKKLKVLFLSADTGGGHRASAEALARQFELLFPGSTYHLLDVITDHAHHPYKNIVKDYKHLSSHPFQWNFLYKLTNTKPVDWLFELHFQILSERTIRERIKSFTPDVVISVHPLMNNIPSMCCQKISQETSTHLPFFTVITDLGSAHIYWFSAAKGNGRGSRAEKLFIASDQIKSIATSRGRDSVPQDKIVQVGLPIRHDFSIEAKLLGDRMSPEGKEYQAITRQKLNLPPSHKTVLVMGGGEGVGSLSSIVDSLYVEFTSLTLNATILVVCGRNTKLKSELLNKEWDELLNNHNPNSFTIASLQRLCVLGPAMKNRKCDMINVQNDEYYDDGENEENTSFEIKVVPLGFVTNMAEYMVAADILVSKAGPGTIAEATSLCLPIMLTNFLPGQEEGNVDFVKIHNCGDYIPDKNPKEIASKVGEWLCNPNELEHLSKASKAAGNPNAAEEIVKSIGESTLRWKEVDEIVTDNSNCVPLANDSKAD